MNNTEVRQQINQYLDELSSEAEKIETQRNARVSAK